eukprot:6999570-Prymnesium_polylepis.1
MIRRLMRTSHDESARGGGPDARPALSTPHETWRNRPARCAGGGRLLQSHNPWGTAPNHRQVRRVASFSHQPLVAVTQERSPPGVAVGFS